MRSLKFTLPACLFIASPYLAAAENILEEVIVTAQKRTENLQDTPISMASLGQDTLRRLAISSVGDLAYHIPNLSMTPFPNSPNAPRLFIRGVGSGDPQVTTDTSVGVYMDGVYLARSIGLGLEVADIERIEVLRGPQGTLYGRNTTGGAVNIITVKPGPELGFTQELSGGELALFRSKTMLNLSLSESLFVRAAYARNERDGAVKNTGEGPDFGSYEKEGLRLDVRYLAGDFATIDYGYDYSDSTFASHYYQLLKPNAFFEGILPVAAGRLERASLPTPYRSGDSDTDGHNLTITIPTAFGDIKSITSRRTVAESAYQDYSANPFLSVIRNATARTDQKQLSQELQWVGSTASGAVDYVFGAYYFEEDGDVFLVDEIGLIGLTLPAVDVSATNTAKAAYAQVSWNPSPESPWQLTVGARYSADDREAVNRSVGSVQKSFDEVTPSITVRYILSDTASLYAKAVTGYKSGGFNIRAADFTQPFAPETLTSYEAGIKSEWMEQRLRVNAAVFYADYKDMQLDIVVPDQPNPALTQTENAGEADITGLEVDLLALLAPGIQISVSYGYLDTEVKRVEGDDARFWVLQNAPESQLSTALDWTLWSGDRNEFRVAFDYTWRDQVFTSARPNPPNDPGDYIPGYGIGNVRAVLAGRDWIGRGEFEVAAWVRNVFDRTYQVEGQGSFYQLHADRLGVFGDYRHAGIDFRYTF